MTTRINLEMVGIARSAQGWIFSACLFVWASAAEAQVVVPVGGYWNGGAATVESAAAHGAADMIRSEGYYNLTTAQGMVFAEKARALNIENRKETLRAYNAGKEEYAARQAQKREQNRRSAETVAAAAKAAAPAPLGPDAFDPQTGKINWPKALLDSRFAAKRAEVDRLAKISVAATESGDSQAKILAATAQMTTMLKDNISKIPANDYMKARRFLESLAYTASQG